MLAVQSIEPIDLENAEYASGMPLEEIKKLKALVNTYFTVRLRNFGVTRKLLTRRMDKGLSPTKDKGRDRSTHSVI